MTGLRIVGEHEFKHHAGLDVDKYTRQLEVYAAAVHISPADALGEVLATIPVPTAAGQA